MLSEPLEVVRQLTTVLDRLGIRYVVAGSLASSVYGIPRATQDVDLVAEIKLHQAAEFAAMLTGDFYVDVNTIVDAIRSRLSSLLQRYSNFHLLSFGYPFCFHSPHCGECNVEYIF